MSSSRFWCRRIRLRLGDNSNTSNAIQLGTTGSEFDIDFNIKKSRTSSSNKSSINIYNLDKSTRSYIDNEFDRAILEAGYFGDQDGTNYSSLWGPIFDGYTTKVIHERQGPDIVTRLQCIDGGVAHSNTRVCCTWAGGTPIRSIVAAIVADMKDIQLGDISGIPASRVVPEARSFNGTGNSRKILEQLAENEDARMYIDNNTLNIISNDIANIEGLSVVPLISRSTGMVGSPSKTEKGVQVKTLIQPNLKINGIVRVVDEFIGTGRNSREDITRTREDDYEVDPSEIGERGAGIFRINSITYSGSNYKNEFYAILECQSSDGYTINRPIDDKSPVNATPCQSVKGLLGTVI